MRSTAATRKLTTACIAAALLAATVTARGEVYTFRDAQGVDHFADSPRPGWRLFDLRAGSADPESYDAMIRESAAESKIDPWLVKAVIRVESGFDPEAASDKGAHGLMQLTLPMARASGVADVYDPRQNIRAGVRHLRRLLDRFSNDPKLALAAYNAGAGAVSRYGGLPPYRETRSYVRKVLRLRREYRRLGYTRAAGSV
jgi:soluble lytic murein transglycosylase-like protein